LSLPVVPFQRGVLFVASVVAKNQLCPACCALFSACIPFACRASPALV
jgi:hypothetical protein